MVPPLRLCVRVCCVAEIHSLLASSIHIASARIDRGRRSASPAHVGVRPLKNRPCRGTRRWQGFVSRYADTGPLLCRRTLTLAGPLVRAGGGLHRPPAGRPRGWTPSARSAILPTQDAAWLQAPSRLSRMRMRPSCMTVAQSLPLRSKIRPRARPRLPEVLGLSWS